MNTPKPPAPARVPQGILLLMTGLFLVVGMVLLMKFGLRPPAPVASLPETHLTNLVMNAGRWMVRGGTNGFTGVLFDTYADGAKKSRSAVSNGWLQGISQGWFTNGQVQVEEHFVKSVSHGTRTKWHPNGRKMSEAGIVDGKLHGLFSRWNEEGVLTEEVEMKEGKADGFARSFYPSGFVKTEVRMKAGEVVDQKSFQDGELKPQL